MPWPVWNPGGQFAGLTPHSSVTRCLPKFATQTLSAPSTAIPQGIVMPPPANGFDRGTPAGLISVTEGVPAGDEAPLGQGMLTTPEFETLMSPRLTAAIPSG